MGANVIDGSIDFSGGSNSGLTADRIAKNQFEKGINVSCKNGSLQPRPRLIHIPVRVITNGSEAGISYQKIFDAGKFQGERTLRSDRNSYTISVRGGIIFKIDYYRGTATVIRHGADDRIASLYRRVDIQPDGRFMVVFDWPNMPVIIDGDKAYRSNFYATDERGIPTPQIPQSLLGVFVQSRFWVANAVNEFTAGDPTGDVTTPDAAITFYEVYGEQSAYREQAFNLGAGFGNVSITAMGFLSSRNQQARVQATIYGPLYIGTKQSIHVYNAELPRAEWANGTFGRVELYGTGIVGQRAHTVIGSDVMFQSAAGSLHSMSKNQNDERSGWATTVISREVDDWLKPVNKSYLDIGFVSFYDKLVLAGAKPIRIPIAGYRGQPVYDYAHEGMVALELDNVSGIASPAAPVWAGLWTGVRPMDVLTVDQAMYVISKDVDGYNRTYLLNPHAIYDTCNQQRRRVKGRVYFRAFDCEQPFTDKVEHSLDINLGNVQGDLKLTTYRKPLNAAVFGKWGEYTYTESCTDSCDTDGQLAPNEPVGYRVLSFGNPEEVPCNPTNGEPASTFRETQVMLEFEAGDFRLDKIKLKAEALDEADTDGTPCTAKVKEQPKAQCNFKGDVELYSIAPRVGD